MARRSTNSREAFKVKHNVFDEFTNKNLYKLITEGYFEGLESPISIGKESNVFTALTKEGERVVVKIYRLETCDFNRMYEYIKGDPRYLHLKKRKRNVIFAWVQREFRNLMKAREANVSVPLPITFKDNILVEECIQVGEHISSKLKDDIPKKPVQFYEKVAKNMKKLHHAGLVHADLSPFNILNRDGIPVFIDFSQATSLEHAMAQSYLKRDIRNISSFFNKIGIEANEKNLKKQVTT